MHALVAPHAQRRAAPVFAQARGWPVLAAWVTVATLATVFAGLGGVLPWLLFERPAMTAGSGRMVELAAHEAALLRLQLAGVIVVMAVLALAQGISLARLGAVVRLWAPLIGFVALSMLWAGSGDAMMRVLAFAAMIGAGALLCAAPGCAARLPAALYLFCVGAAAASLALYVVARDIVTFSDGYGAMFTGITRHKGHISDIAAIGALLAWERLRGPRPASLAQRAAHAAALGVCALVLMLGATLSSIIGAAFAMAALGWFRAALVGAVVMAAALPALHVALEPLFAAMGRDATLTGRSLLWAHALAASREAPLLGAGFVHLSDTAEWRALLQVHFTSDTFFIPHSHNLWLESLFKLGLAGTALLAVTLLAPLGAAPSLGCRDEKRLLLFIAVKSALTVPFLNTGFTALVLVLALSSIAAADADLRSVAQSRARAGARRCG